LFQKSTILFYETTIITYQQEYIMGLHYVGKI
jgi:hypothetical protein